jgi:thiol-disulfide isomerase/thioredoxin
MRSFLLFLLIVFGEVNATWGQQASVQGSTPVEGNFVEYTDWSLLSTTEGTRYVLVSAEWCAPCQQLKAKIKDMVFPRGINVIIVDYDRSTAIADTMLGSNGTLPRLIQYRTDANGKTEGVYWNPGKKTLDEFFGFR